MEKKLKGFQEQLDDFITWMEKDGMLDRWAKQKEIDGVKKNRRRLNKLIRNEKIIMEAMA
jgi:hypothetical protein